jgi:ABC-type Fe3+ transport system substrate-binding protein
MEREWPKIGLAALSPNFARAPQGNDTAQLRAVASGECGITVANTYYVGRLIGSDDPKNNAITDALTIVFPNQGDRGAHVNISGAGVTRYAPNKENAIRFLEYLTSDFAQRLFAEGNNEYPIVGPTSGASGKPRPVRRRHDQLGSFRPTPRPKLFASLTEPVGNKGESYGTNASTHPASGWRDRPHVIGAVFSDPRH